DAMAQERGHIHSDEGWEYSGLRCGASAAPIVVKSHASLKGNNDNKAAQLTAAPDRRPTVNPALPRLALRKRHGVTSAAVRSRRAALVAAAVAPLVLFARYGRRSGER